METLRAFLKSLSPAERTKFARRCGTTVGYLRKATYVRSKIGGDLAVAIDRESCGAVRLEDLRPDIDWTYVRTGKSRRSPRCKRAASPPVDSSPADAAA